MSEEKSALAILATPFDNKYDADLKNPSYREAHKALVKVLDKNIDVEKQRLAMRLSTTIKLALVGVLALAVTITACTYIVVQGNIHMDDNATRVKMLGK